MQRRIAILALTALLALGSHAASAADAKPVLSQPEMTFVAQVQTELAKRYATIAAAEKAGYARYTNVDETGAISYVNTAHWISTEISEPAQLWYDVKGRLIGADYSVLQADHATAPEIFGVASARAEKIGAHVHYVVKDAGGTYEYDKAVGAKKWVAAGLDLQHPTAEGLVKVGAVKSASQVALVFLYPAIWDLSVWVIPNPNGPFAEMNPNVKAGKPMSSM